MIKNFIAFLDELRSWEQFSKIEFVKKFLEFPLFPGFEKKREIANSRYHNFGRKIYVVFLTKEWAEKKTPELRCFF